MAYYYKRGKYYWVSFSENGKRLRQVLETRDGKRITDEKLARYYTNEIENQVARGDSPIPIDNALASIVLKEYQQYSQGIKAAKTIGNEFGSLKYTLEDLNLGLLKSFNEERIRKYLDGRINDGQINHETANNILKYWNAFLNFAVKRKYLSRNPISGMKRYKVDHEVIPRFLSKEEIGVVIKAAEGEVLSPAVAVAIYTGMRMGELRRLALDDVSLQNETILVKRSKSGRARGIPIHCNLKKILTVDIFPLNFTNHLRVFKRIRRKAFKLLYDKNGVLDIGWHTFRHTFASHLVMKGVPLATVAELLGHSSIKMTMRYSHLLKDHVKASINKLDF